MKMEEITKHEGHVLFLEDQMTNEWEHYIKDLFTDDRTITNHKFKYMTISLKNGSEYSYKTNQK